MKPKQGTNEWWNMADQLGMNDIRAGRYVVVKNKRELKRLFTGNNFWEKINLSRDVEGKNGNLSQFIASDRLFH